MSKPAVAITRTADIVLEDAVHHSPVDLAQAKTHRRALKLAAPWAWCLALPWLAGAALMQARNNSSGFRIF